MYICSMYYEVDEIILIEGIMAFLQESFHSEVEAGVSLP